LLSLHPVISIYI